MKTNQTVSTPTDLIAAVERRFGPLTIDLAANEENRKAPIWFGPGSGSDTQNALAVFDWATQVIASGGLAWLNPPFADAAKWVRECYDTIQGPERGYKILMLLPAQVCNNYVRDYVNGTAYRIELSPRPFAKEVRDCMLVVWTPEKLTGIGQWKWR